MYLKLCDEVVDYVGSGKFVGKVVFVMGGDSGIGCVVVIGFVKEGVDVVIVYLKEFDDVVYIW